MSSLLRLYRVREDLHLRSVAQESAGSSVPMYLLGCIRPLEIEYLLHSVVIHPTQLLGEDIVGTSAVLLLSKIP